MLRRFLIFGWLGFASASLAATFTVPSLSGSAIQTTINTAYAAGSNNVVYLPAGTYNISSSITVPCNNGLTITGPASTPATAILNMTAAGNDIFNATGCNGITFTYLAFQNAGAVYFGAANNNGITFLHNQFLSLPSQTCTSSTYDGCASYYTPANAALFFDGSIGTVSNGVLSTLTSDVLIEYNQFGDANSCTAVFAQLEDDGGTCSGITTHTGEVQAMTVRYNSFLHVEEPIHMLNIISGFVLDRTESVISQIDIEYNYFLNWHRIGTEIQVGTPDSPLIYQHNALVDPLGSDNGTFGTSFACCLSGFYEGVDGYSPGLIFNDNVEISSQPAGAGDPPYGVEFWGDGAQGTNSLIQGNFSNGYTWGYGAAPWLIENNYICGPKYATQGGYISNEEGQSNPPTQSGNVTAPSCTARASTAPTISPASGAYTSPPTITLADSGANTSVWYTSDGSTPVPGSGTAKLYTAPFSITLPVTIKAVGMWGTPPQPTSYPAGYGYVPSAAQTANYTSSGGIVLTGVTLTNTGSVQTLNVGQSIQMTATCSYSDGSTTNCNSTDAHGNGVSAWNSSSAAVSISASGVATAVSAGAANLTATVAGLTSPAFAMSATVPTLTLSTVSLATTGGITTLVAGGQNQLVATCTYSNGSTTNCSSTDAHGNGAGFTSSAASVAAVSGTGLVTAVAAGGANLQASVGFSSSASQWGANQETTAGTTSPNYINQVYFVLGSQAGGYTAQSCSFYLPGQTLTVGAKYDCGLIPAPSATSQATGWQCYGTYTVTSASQAAGWITVTLGGCGTLAANSGWWVAVDTDQGGTSDVGAYNCGGSCNGAAPAAPGTAPGTGTYACGYTAATYGLYTGLPSTVHTGGCAIGQVQASQYVTLGQPPLTSNTVALTVTAATPMLTSVSLSTPGNVTAVTEGTSLQFSAHCMYSDGSSTNCSVADIYGNAVTQWTTSNGSAVTIGAVGSAMPGLATATGAGASNIGAFVGAVASAPYGLTVNAPVVTLTGLSLATTNGVTSLLVGSTNALLATCIYSDGTSTRCNATDVHGNKAGSFVSSSPAKATVNASTGLVTAIAAGNTSFTASAGGVTSPSLPLTVLPVPHGRYTITISGPVKSSGVVVF